MALASSSMAVIQVLQDFTIITLQMQGQFGDVASPSPLDVDGKHLMP